MKDKEFVEYVTSKNNEFSLWIKEILKDKKLAKKIRRARSRAEMVNILEDKRLGREETKNWLQRFIYK
jgi:hypothetical protein